MKSISEGGCVCVCVNCVSGNLGKNEEIRRFDIIRLFRNQKKKTTWVFINIIMQNCTNDFH